MVFKKIMEKIKFERTDEEPEEEFLEVTPEGELGQISVKVETLRNYGDAERIQQMVREGNVVFVRIRDLRQKDINELKKSVERVRKTVAAMEGDIVGVDEDFLIVTPNFAKVYRGKEETGMVK